jgi:TRAP-type C4-dicarboxylate transport system substrate-binding protein
MRFIKFTMFVALIALAVQFNGFALTIKLGSIAPENSPWGEALNKMAAEWSRLSNGEIELKVYHNSIAGDEANMLRKIKMGQLQGAIFSSFGLTEICPQVLTLSYPLLIHTDAELDYVLAQLTPEMEKSALEKNYVVITWSKAGWIRFFTKEKVTVPEDLKGQRIVANPDDPAFSQVWSQLGYHQVPVSIPDTLQALNSGLVTAIWSAPLAVAGYQWFGIANHMTDLKIAPFVGAFIISKNVWESIPENLRSQLIKVAHDISLELDTSILQLEAVAFMIMKQHGLVIHPVSPEAEALWAEEFRRGASIIIGKTFAVETYNHIKVWLENYRRK